MILMLTENKTVKLRGKSVSPLLYMEIILFLWQGVKPQVNWKMCSTVVSAIQKEKFIRSHPFLHLWI